MVLSEKCSLSILSHTFLSRHNTRMKRTGLADLLRSCPLIRPAAYPNRYAAELRPVIVIPRAEARYLKEKPGTEKVGRT